ncbi:SLBB domain-containing protein [Flavobacterium sp. UMI-01]|uniref:SLBB domain-containing protein n=1 Tax=Flavobacterium sp. UMI-01 TaxID=1441053 RepID=UPI001C7E0517|nr:SLBB domain-containing protein [Flavobacterium sp. UMI-01]GIZ07424.1 capsule polysaccharide transporter [Flavobacterium sp. UMI-01]
MKKRILIIVLFLICSVGYTQDFLKSRDLSTFKAESLTQSDIEKMDSQLKVQGTSIEQVRALALSRGMNENEFEKLKTRLNRFSNSIKKERLNEGNAILITDKAVTTKVKDTLNRLIFGSELFDNPTLNFEPNLQLATPVNYILGPGDDLQISVYGVQEFDTSVKVSNEGKIDIQYVGQISVSGMTIEAATSKIKNAIARIYSTVSSGQSQVSVNLGSIRTIRITVIGGKQPGNYSLSSLSSVYHALHVAGGPGVNGSYRNIQLIRNNSIIRYIDIYRFLINGDQSDNVGLKDNDVIRIPTYDNRVTIEGEVKRPGIFELKKGETFQDLIYYASGFNDLSYSSSVQVTQKTAKEFKVLDLQKTDFNTYKPQSGDVFKVGKILNRFENKIKISGAVFRPDTYSFYEGMRITDLIKKAEGLKEDAYLQRARILRLKSNLTTEIVDVNIEKAFSGDNSLNLALKKNDEVTIYSILDFKEDFKIIINGEVKIPGEYAYHDNLSLNDVLIQAGGLKESASSKVEIARMINTDVVEAKNTPRVELFTITINPKSNEQAENFILKPFDVINVRKLAVYNVPEQVKVSGAIVHEGNYVLTSKYDKILTIIKRAGGLTPLADLDGIKIKRPVQTQELEDIKTIDLNLGKNDSVHNKVIKKAVLDNKFSVIPIDWRKIMKDANSYDNVTLQSGDEIVINAQSESVKVSGNVLLNSEISFIPGKNIKYYINSAGGIDNKGWMKNAYVIYPNGKAAVTKSFLGIRNTPKVLPGSQVIVPEKPEGRKLSTTELLTVTSVFTSLAGIILGIIRL